VYREGAETALFYQALLGEAQHLTLPILLGVAVGAGVLAVVFTLFHRFGVRIPLRPFFAATSALLYLMAFVMAGRGIHELQDANIVSATHVRGVPVVELLGVFPTVETLAAQGVLVVALFVALTVSLRRSRATP
jgi:high-affinity iron transporter